MKQTARDLTDAIDGFVNGVRYVLMDRDDTFCPSFREFLHRTATVRVRWRGCHVGPGGMIAWRQTSRSTPRRRRRL